MGGLAEEEKRVRKKNICNDNRKTSVESAKVCTQDAQVSCVERMEPPPRPLETRSLSSRIILIQTEQNLKAARIRVCVCPLSDPRPSPCVYSLTHSVLGALVIGYHHWNKGKASHLQKAHPIIAFLFSATCKIYFTSLRISAVFINWTSK